MGDFPMWGGRPKNGDQCYQVPGTNARVSCADLVRTGEMLEAEAGLGTHAAAKLFQSGPGGQFSWGSSDADTTRLPMPNGLTVNIEEVNSWVLLGLLDKDPDADTYRWSEISLGLNLIEQFKADVAQDGYDAVRRGLADAGQSAEDWRAVETALHLINGDMHLRDVLHPELVRMAEEALAQYRADEAGDQTLTSPTADYFTADTTDPALGSSPAPDYFTAETTDPVMGGCPSPGAGYQGGQDTHGYWDDETSPDTLPDSSGSPDATYQGRQEAHGYWDDELAGATMPAMGRPSDGGATGPGQTMQSQAVDYYTPDASTDTGMSSDTSYSGSQTTPSFGDDESIPSPTPVWDGSSGVGYGASDPAMSSQPDLFTPDTTYGSSPAPEAGFTSTEQTTQSTTDDYYTPDATTDTGTYSDTSYQSHSSQDTQTSSGDYDSGDHDSYASYSAPDSGGYSYASQPSETPTAESPIR